MKSEEYNVVISGAGLAGSTAATVMAEAGLRVLVVDRAASKSAAKKLCGHYILGSAADTLKRLNLETELRRAGAVSSRMRMWSPDGGWMTRGTDSVPNAVSLERRLLDPIVRSAADAMPSCAIQYGTQIAAVVDGSERRHKITLRSSASTDTREIHADLVVGADGTNSHLCKVLGIPRQTTDNNRSMYWAYFRAIDLQEEAIGRIWQVDSDVAVAFPTNDGLVQLGVFAAKLGSRGSVRSAEDIKGVIKHLPDAPRLDDAVLARGPIGTANYPLATRPCVPRDAVALVGDAAITSDPLMAVGCSWALRSGEMLADALLAYASGAGEIKDGLKVYERSHKFFGDHHRMIATEARKAAGANRVQRAVRLAATRNPFVASEMAQYINQNRTATAIVRPKVVAEVIKSLTAQRNNVEASGFK